MISFIMMAKNVEKYIDEAIIELQKENLINWELIIVDDHSDDSTFEAAYCHAEHDSRITVVRNKFVGKVLGTNYGYSLTKGDIIKCIDSDDVLLNNFFKEYDNLQKHEAHCHNAYIVGQNLSVMTKYLVPSCILTESYEFVLSGLISLPKWSWSFNRRIADIIFPMPENLPFEDVWIAMNIKRNAASIYHIKSPVYLYRQHTSNTFGGILNYEKDKVIFRASRLIKLIEIFKREERIISGYATDILDNVYEYNKTMRKEDLTLRDIFSSRLRFNSKLKIWLIRNFPYLIRAFIITKWKLSRS
ncbi:glycosyltransferase [Geovibrio thiophilus]|uniref:Glycosyltransferase n=1 Tax=Geovibrio thiophilus TaxID=139438 RepID=A0A410K144_9BACT|nr:glycosyltransferase [Geovibrio thiophilus]QAR34186.1 glycosyltransferase [Geovibrio thiophilus]